MKLEFAAQSGTLLGYNAVKSDLDSLNSFASNRYSSKYVLSHDVNITPSWIDESKLPDRSVVWDRWGTFYSSIVLTRQLCEAYGRYECPGPLYLVKFAMVNPDHWLDFNEINAGGSLPTLPEDLDTWSFCGLDVVDCRLGFSGLMNCGRQNPPTPLDAVLNNFNLFNQLEDAQAYANFINDSEELHNHAPFYAMAIFAQTLSLSRIV